MSLVRESPIAINTPVQALRHIAERYGTPTYAYDVRRLRAQVDRLRASLPREIELLYSLKANPSLGLCGLLAEWGLGADVASAGELLVALTAGMVPARICINGPYKSADTMDRVAALPEALLSIDSVSELEMLAARDLPHRVLLRLRPDYSVSTTCSIGSESRFGIAVDELPVCRSILASGRIVTAGFHVFSGSQLSDADTVIQHLRNALALSLRASEVLQVTPEILNLGGGFGIPYGTGEQDLDLDPIGRELEGIVDRVTPARVIVELGRYIVAQAGWYLTTVVGRQTRRGRQAVVVDGGIHHRADICGMGVFTGGLPPVVLNASESPLAPTDVLGCLCLPHDVLAESSMLPELSSGAVLAFRNGGAYGLSASPLAFLSHPPPAEVAFEGTETEVLRARPLLDMLLTGQSRIQRLGLRRFV